MFIKVKGVWSSPEGLDKHAFSMLIHVDNILYLAEKDGYCFINIKGSGPFYVVDKFVTLWNELHQKGLSTFDPKFDPDYNTGMLPQSLNQEQFNKDFEEAWNKPLVSPFSQIDTPTKDLL